MDTRSGELSVKTAAILSIGIILAAVIYSALTEKKTPPPAPIITAATDQTSHPPFGVGCAGSGPFTPDNIGKPAPAFSLEDVDGKTWTLEKCLEKGYAVFGFFAPVPVYCASGKPLQFPTKEDVARFPFHKKVQIIGVALTGPTIASAKPKLVEYIRKHAITWPVLIDAPKETDTAYSRLGVRFEAKRETWFLVGPDKRILAAGKQKILDAFSIIAQKEKERQENANAP